MFLLTNLDFGLFYSREIFSKCFTGKVPAKIFIRRHPRKFIPAKCKYFAVCLNRESFFLGIQSNLSIADTFSRNGPNHGQTLIEIPLYTLIFFYKQGKNLFQPRLCLILNNRPIVIKQ